MGARTDGISAEMSTEPTHPEAYLTPPPPIPYTKGRRFTVRSHIPPAPKRKRANDSTLSPETDAERRELTPLQRCVLHPPPAGSLGASSLEFEVSDEFKVGNQCTSQVAAVRILRADTGCCSGALTGVTTAVAKIYDPLYYDHIDTIDPFFCVNRFYTYEAAAYERLADLQGIIPAYYGSYSLDLPVDDTKTRTVRLILMERIHGSPMRDVDPRHFSQAERKQIMRMVIDGESAIYARDIRLVDLHPRNVLVVVEGESSNSERCKNGRVSRVVHIDFEAIWLSRWWCWEDPVEEQKHLPGTYISPLLRWHEAWKRHAEFRGWIFDWDYQSWLEDEFGHMAAEITPNMREVFLPEKMLKKAGNGPPVEEVRNQISKLISAGDLPRDIQARELSERLRERLQERG
jgi:hypothetical protein